MMQSSDRQELTARRGRHRKKLNLKFEISNLRSRLAVWNFNSLISDLRALLVTEIGQLLHRQSGRGRVVARRGDGQDAFDIFGDDVGFEVDSVIRAQVGEVRDSPSRRTARDLELLF